MPSAPEWAASVSHARKQQGFTLIEVMIAAALSLSLLATLLAATGDLRRQLAISADQAGVIERAAQALALLSHATAHTVQLTTAATTLLQPCASPVAVSVPARPAMLVAARGEYGCLPAGDMPAHARLLLIDQLIPCDPGCPDASEPGWLWLDPGCHPVLDRSTPEIRRVARRERPVDCDASTTVMLLERTLYYFRDHAYSTGDGLGALMVKRLLPETPVRWSRAERLLAGVTDWVLSPRWAESRCSLSAGCPSLPADGVEVTLSVRGWLRDPTTVSGFSQVTLSRTLSGTTQVSAGVAAGLASEARSRG